MLSRFSVKMKTPSQLKFLLRTFNSKHGKHKCLMDECSPATAKGVASPPSLLGRTLSEVAKPQVQPASTMSAGRDWEGQSSQRKWDHHEQRLLGETESTRSLVQQQQHKHSDLSCSLNATAEDSPPKQRVHFLNRPYPDTHFGPKARILPNLPVVTHVQHPASYRLTWSEPPANVLVIRKIRDDTLAEPFKELCRFLVEEKQLTVYVERSTVEAATLSKDPTFATVRGQLCVFCEGHDNISDRVDLIVCLGGDGTLLHASSLFQTGVPPVMAFNFGTLGFLMPFMFESYRTDMAKVLEGDVAITLRSRLQVKVERNVRPERTPRDLQLPSIGSHSQEDGGGDVTGESGTGAVPQLQVLNEVVVDRGAWPDMSNLDLYLDGHYITSVQGDGVIVSTPTGSTAYAASAGAPMVHPGHPAILVTPVCPHSLSFRPIVVPAGVELAISLSPDAQSTAWASFDGRNRQEIRHGDVVKITMSRYPLPSVCRHDVAHDWFESLARCLYWNANGRGRRAPMADRPPLCQIPLVQRSE